MFVRAIALVLALGAACSSGTKGGPVTNQPGPGDAADPVTALEALGRAIDADDGAALAALVHPVHGTTLWFTPGAGYAVFARIEPGATGKPSAVAAAAGADDPAAYYGENYWPIVKRSIAEGLTRLDREPADPQADIYGTCAEEEEAPQPFRAYLQGGRDDQSFQEFDLAGDGSADPAKVLRDLTVFHTWGFSAYLARHEGGWRVVHLLVTEPCSA